MNPVLLYFIAAFGLSLVLTYWVRGWAKDTALVDVPDAGRHAHARPVPRAGGIAIYVSVAIVLVVGFFLGVSHGAGNLRQIVGLIAGTTAMFGIGLLDDWNSMRARTKFLLEILVASGVFYAGVRMTGNAFGIEMPLWASYPMTVLWIVGVTNAFNLIDGSDGIAAGAALFASVCMAIVSAMGGDSLGVIVGVAVAGATLGFLFFNFPPASIFLGDSGSLFLGFTLAVLGIVTTQEASTTLAVAIPVLSLGLPILDTLLTIGRRFLRRQPIFTSDRAHIHHRLRDLGHSPRAVAFLLYGFCAIFSLLSLLLIGPVTAPYAAAVFVVAGAAVWLAVQRLRIPELLEVRRIVKRGMRQRDVIAHNVRLREALIRLRNAQSPDGLVHALYAACEGGEFDRMELLLNPDEGDVLAGAPGVVGSDSGHRWSWERLNNASPERRWELRVPVQARNGRTVGRLSVWCSVDREFLLTDVRLLTTEFQPAIHSALVRVGEKSAASAVVKEITSAIPAAV
jgi:UDP-GlcNAc:undecaprenyl-phosphate/decaprenyl-phosphate GlcNAc-1-phosphate transferase